MYGNAPMLNFSSASDLSKLENTEEAPRKHTFQLARHTSPPACFLKLPKLHERLS